MNPLDSLLGRSGSPVKCVVKGAASVHWFATNAKPGDKCLCGETIKEKPKKRVKEKKV